MSWKTKYISGKKLELLNHTFHVVGYEPADEGFAANISNKYRGEIDTYIKEVAEMSESSARDSVGRINFIKKLFDEENKESD